MKLDEIWDRVNLPHHPIANYPLCILLIDMHAYYCIIAHNTIQYHKIYIVPNNVYLIVLICIVCNKQ